MTSGPRRVGAAAGRWQVDPNYWDPIAHQHEQPTPHCLLRVRRDIAELHTDPLPGVFVAPEETDLTRIHAVLVGPTKTPYQGGFFHFLLKCPPDYPMSPPRVRIMTTDGGRVMFNRHLYNNGKVCLSLLGTFLGSSWTPAQTVGSVLLSVQSIMTEDPFDDQRRVASVSLVAGGQHPLCATRVTVLHETIRAAVCDVVESCLRGNDPWPASMREAVLGAFGDNYPHYEDACKDNLAADGREMAGTGTICPDGSKYGFGTLLARLQSLNEQVREEGNAAAAGVAAANAASD
ncbi:ubiquitin-conjugating enzyme E2 Z-like [Dermacentor variabilis]|uniref:ubiquitin-conjugating enzyme E2 Z-like n=1 Tax=Dermacentor variabilis TaxID=34621 RepID=UPI003F5B9383